MSRTGAARILLVRHAQASFGSDDYDRLSERGHQQARLLGVWLVGHPRLRIENVCIGGNRRHEQTYAEVRQAAAEAGRILPDAETDDGWNEFDHEALLRGYAAHAPDDPLLAMMRKEPSPAGVRGLLANVFRAWGAGNLDAHMTESLDAFRGRIERARKRLDFVHEDGVALVVSSGGVIARCAQTVLGLDEERTIQLNLGLANTGIAEFQRDETGWTLMGWNNLPHLAPHEHADLVSYY
jgi:broad specificity phosphatase PhoE